MEQIYLDNSATTKPSDAAVEAAGVAMTRVFANPSSRHAMGLTASKELSAARNMIAAKLNVLADDVFFTGGGTSSDNLAILGGADIHLGTHAVTTAIEHPAVLNAFKALEKQGFDVTYINPDSEGNISLESITSSLRENTSFISIMHVNNETGAVMPVDKIKSAIDELCPKAIFHCDAVQSFGKTQLLPEKWGMDLVSVSAHKIHGLKGCGALYIRKGINLKPVIFGGGQEKNIYSGTENMPAIMAFAAACGEISADDSKYVAGLFEILRRGIYKIEGAHINSPANGLPYILNVSFDSVPSEVVLNALSGEGVMVSAGSACASSKAGASHVLAVMDKERAKSAVRFSLSKQNTENELYKTLEILDRIIPMLIKAIGGRR